MNATAKKRSVWVGAGILAVAAFVLLQNVRASHFPPSAPVIASFTASPGTVTSGGSSVLSWSASDRAIGWFVGEQNPAVSISTNGGGTWTGQAITDVVGGYLHDIYFIDENNGWAAGQLQLSSESFPSGKIVRTTDGGASWTVAYNSMTGPIGFSAIQFINATTGWAAGFSNAAVYLRKTTDGGGTWALLDTGITESGSLNDVYFVNTNTGWIAGALAAGGPILYKTADGGATWNPQSTGISEGLTSIYFVDANTGWAVGRNGRILKTTDGGASWTVQNSGTTAQLNKVTFINSTTGWAVGQVGTILKTTNGGATWTTLLSGGTINFTDVYFANENTGWATASGEMVYKTVNGGANWWVQYDGPSLFAYSIFFLNTTVTSCSATTPAGWTTNTASMGSQTVTPAATTMYTMTCSNLTGSDARSVTVTVSSPTPPPPPPSPTPSPGPTPPPGPISYGVRTLGANELSGFAWGSDTMGWISFNSANCDTDADGQWDACGLSGPSAPYKVWIRGTLPNSPPRAENLQSNFLDRCVGPFAPTFSFDYLDNEADPMVQYTINVYDYACDANKDQLIDNAACGAIGSALAPVATVGPVNVNPASYTPSTPQSAVPVSYPYNGIGQLQYGRTYYYTVEVRDQAHLN